VIYWMDFCLNEVLGPSLVLPEKEDQKRGPSAVGCREVSRTMEQNQRSIVMEDEGVVTESQKMSRKHNPAAAGVMVSESQRQNTNGKDAELISIHNERPEGREL
jgi:hypothetical protein